LKNGNKYRVRKQINGVKYYFNFDEKPTQKMIQDAMDKRNIMKKQGNSFKVCCDSYVKSKENVLSPSTIKEYKRIINFISDELLRKDIGVISQYDIQKEVNNYSEGRSAKTVRNFHSFISSVLGLFREDLALHTRLPMQVKKTPYIPNESDVKAILDASYGTKYEVPLKFACYGLRRSEICALTEDDIKGNTITINKAKVKKSEDEYVIKNTTKTSSSTREIYISDELVERIKELGLYEGNPNCINQYLTRTQKKLNIPHFSLHKLRHYFVSRLSEAGVDDATIMELGGYETDKVMKSVYRHSLKDEKEKKEILNNINLI